MIVRPVFFVGGRIFAILIAAVGIAVDLTGTSILSGTERLTPYIAFFLFAVLTIVREAELYFSSRPDIVVEADNEDNYARLRVTNNGARGVFAATAQLMKSGAPVRTAWPIRWRTVLSREVALNKGASDILNLASLEVKMDEDPPRVHYGLVFYSARIETGTTSHVEHFEHVAKDETVLEITVTSDPPLRKPYKKAWSMQPDPRNRAQPLLVRRGNERN